MSESEVLAPLGTWDYQTLADWETSQQQYYEDQEAIRQEVF